MKRTISFYFWFSVPTCSLWMQKCHGFISPNVNSNTFHRHRHLEHEISPSSAISENLNVFYKHTVSVQKHVALSMSVPSQTQQEIELALWMLSFSSLHIGMSAVRESLIAKCGGFAQNANLVNQNMLTLPQWWPGDDVGGSDIFPDAQTAGRQIYRLLYTIVSFTTLGGALMSYLDLSVLYQKEELLVAAPLTEIEYGIYFATSTLSFATSISSLFNASPLSLMPGFQTTAKSSSISSLSSISSSSPSPTIAGLIRNDALKLQPRGLTRITRHPLILPVVPWGIATSHLTGGRVMDWILFGGLALYAIAGCACQDLRIANQEGSVGTVFRPSWNSNKGDSALLQNGGGGGNLDDFFAATSFVPFAAVLDGRQTMKDIGMEFPFIPFLALGIPVGAGIENALLQWLDHYYVLK